MPEFVEVAVNVPAISDVFHYHLPPELSGLVTEGHLVQVPFGRQEVQGVVVRHVDQPSVAETRPVSALLDPQPVTTALHLRMVKELAEVSLSPLAAMVSLLIPSGLEQQADAVYTPLAQAGAQDSLGSTQTRLLKLLSQRGPLRGSQIDHAMPRQDWRAAAASLVRKGLLEKHPYLPAPTVRPKLVRTARLAVSPEVARAALADVGRSGTPVLARRQAMLEMLIRENAAVDVSWIYAESGGSLADLRKLAERGLVHLGEEQTWRNSLTNVRVDAFPAVTLTRDQQTCWDEIVAALQQSAAGTLVPPYLLHGVTGSGKTELYLRAVKEVLAAGRQAIVLVPEIALTPQTVNRFLSRFPGRVAVLHSRLSQGERYDTWQRARQGQVGVVVGPRSALFTPLPSPGLLILDECHDDSYYQDEPPFYDARRAAIILARLSNAVCLFGSATPDMASAYQAAQGDWRYLRLPDRVRAHVQVIEQSGQSVPIQVDNSTALELPPVEIVDMRLELQRGNRSMFSQALQQALGHVLQQHQQAILFLNRRGTATHVFCRDCGHVLKCPSCDIPLTFHAAGEALLCHRCGYRRRMPSVCPVCSGNRIRQYGAGTERVEAELHDMFPAARSLRWDHETTRKKGSHEAILNQFAGQHADILVGTQMLAKGLDLPLVTLVGVVLADPGLNLPDYRAAERTFQVLTQVAGRAGRSPLGGRVIFQTFQPEHYAIQAAANHDFRAFYQKELEYRRQLKYPPFTRLVRLEYRHTNQERAETAARKLAEQLRLWIKEGSYRATDLVGPVPCFFTRMAGLYRWQILLRGPDPTRLLQGRTLSEWRIEVDPPSLL